MPINTTSVRSAGGAFKRSAGGARTRVTGKYYYYATPVFETILNFEDFTSWNNTAHATGMYAANDTADFDLYDGVSEAFIGTITQDYECTPKIAIVDILPFNGNSYNAATSCPMPNDTDFLTPDNEYLAFNYLYGFAQIDSDPGVIQDPPVYRNNSGFVSSQRTLRLFTPTISILPAGRTARSSISTLSSAFYMYPGSTTSPLAKVGNKFYPHKIRVVIDEDTDIDSWYTGKYTDDGWVSIPISTLWTPTRNATTFSGSSYVLSGGYTGTIVHDSCVLQNTRVTLPI